MTGGDLGASSTGLVFLDEAMAVAHVVWLTEGRFRPAGSTIRSWASRGRIGRYHDEAGVWYEAGEIQAYLERRNA